MFHNEENRMKIEFPGPAVPIEGNGISFRAMVDGQTVACQFTAEALQDANPDLRSLLPMEQFSANQWRLLSVAEKKLRAGNITQGIVTIFAADISR